MEKNELKKKKKLKIKHIKIWERAIKLCLCVWISRKCKKCNRSVLPPVEQRDSNQYNLWYTYTSLKTFGYKWIWVLYFYIWRGDKVCRRFRGIQAMAKLYAGRSHTLWLLPATIASHKWMDNTLQGFIFC